MVLDSLQLFPFLQLPSWSGLYLPGQNQCELHDGFLPAWRPSFRPPLLVSLLQGALLGSQPAGFTCLVAMYFQSRFGSLLAPALPKAPNPALNQISRSHVGQATHFTASAQLLTTQSSRRAQLPFPQAVRLEVTSSPTSCLQSPPLIPSFKKKAELYGGLV